MQLANAEPSVSFFDRKVTVDVFIDSQMTSLKYNSVYNFKPFSIPRHNRIKELSTLVEATTLTSYLLLLTI